MGLTTIHAVIIECSLIMSSWFKKVSIILFSVLFKLGNQIMLILKN